MIAKDTSFTLSTLVDESICYIVENHPMDSRVKIREDGICQTLPSNMGTGGGQYTINTCKETKTSGPVTEELRERAVAVDSHPMDSRIRITGDICPTIANEMVKSGCTGPLVLIRRE